MPVRAHNSDPVRFRNGGPLSPKAGFLNPVGKACAALVEYGAPIDQIVGSELVCDSRTKFLSALLVKLA